ncbi:hypothetical protein BDY19DRAFT_954389 [Irpex rosettiformis]|uniref:Uncharacterized protein n=1 Tax=Irpex rosettiformis TaxID=378272 RepID=A0ACB8U086_9APHY|nr:hypothetical protein BDY19DRAFT_954389 [Irpex rosettiformis]
MHPARSPRIRIRALSVFLGRCPTLPARSRPKNGRGSSALVVRGRNDCEGRDCGLPQVHARRFFRCSMPTRYGLSHNGDRDDSVFNYDNSRGSVFVILERISRIWVLCYLNVNATPIFKIACTLAYPLLLSQLSQYKYPHSIIYICSTYMRFPTRPRSAYTPKTVLSVDVMLACKH